MTELIWSPQAIRDPEAIRAYIAADSPVYAELRVRRIVSAIERLAVFPESGPIVPERSTSTLREVITGPYRVVSRRPGGAPRRR